MGRELLILRHAKSAWDVVAASDFERPLAKRGKRDAPRMGEWMLAEGLVPDYVVSSPAVRAAKTVRSVAKALGVAKEDIRWDERIYGGGVAALINVLAEAPKAAKRVLLVGHNPGLEMLVSHLCGGATPRPPDGKLLPTSTLARLKVPGSWGQLRPGCADAVSITRPRDLPND